MDKFSERVKKNRKSHASAQHALFDIKCKLGEIKILTGRTSAYKVLELGIRQLEDQLFTDERRFERIINNKSQRDESMQLQQALNRANAKNAELEKQIHEARTSSGLFIKFCRDKLGI